MIRENHTAVIARNERWTGVAATEPYEAGWATEAVVFVRALAIERGRDVAADVLPPTARVQISADGMRWIDEGTTFPMPQSTEQDTCARVAHFGNWLRVETELPADMTMKVLVTVHLK
jgi:hypothetical protein